ncbi:MAG: hypothetical protein K1X79_06170 [Oligoflexia bacterium]|nr:hypothetical protein [Oligoflexia bacterium]
MNPGLSTTRAAAAEPTTAVDSGTGQHRSSGTSTSNTFGALALVALAAIFPGTANAQKSNAKAIASPPAAGAKADPQGLGTEFVKQKLSTGQELECRKGNDEIVQTAQDVTAMICRQLAEFKLKPAPGIKILVLPQEEFDRRVPASFRGKQNGWSTDGNIIAAVEGVSVNTFSELIKVGLLGITFCWNPDACTAPSWAGDSAAHMVRLWAEAADSKVTSLAELPGYQKIVDGLSSLAQANSGALPSVGDILRRKGGGKVTVDRTAVLSFVSIICPQDNKPASAAVRQAVLRLALGDSASQKSNSEVDIKTADVLAGKILATLNAPAVLKKAEVIALLKANGLDMTSKDFKQRLKDTPNIANLDAYYRLQAHYAEQAVEAARNGKVTAGPDVAGGEKGSPNPEKGVAGGGKPKGQK